MAWIIQSNDGLRVWKTTSRAEARLYAWMSLEFCEYNVYIAGGSGTPVSFIEI